MNMNHSRQSGFSLIELMIVVAIIGIIAAIAYPSYQNHVEKTRRTTAQAELMELAQWMERRYTTSYTYEDDGKRPVLPFSYSPRGRGASDGFYNFDLVEADMEPDTYTLIATPINVQENDSCGNLTLDHQGNREASTGTTEDCW